MPTHRIPLPLVLVFAALMAALGSPAAQAQMGPGVLLAAADATPPAGSTTGSSTRRIYQQRTADGSVVLTDRPIDGAAIQRSWTMVAEDPVEARERSERVRSEAQAVSERIQRQLDSERERNDALERRRLRSIEAQRAAAAARDAEREATVLVLPPRFVRNANLRPPWVAPPPPVVPRVAPRPVTPRAKMPASDWRSAP